MLGAHGYEPQWCHNANTLAAAHRSRFSRIIGRPLDLAWVLWDRDRRTWFPGGPVILGFGGVNVEVMHRKFDECAITWDQLDTSVPPDWPGHTVDWRPDGHPALLAPRGRRLREVNVIERIMPSHWRPRVLHAVEFRFEGSRLAVYNALDENGLTDVPDVNLPIGFWRRVHVA